MTAAHERWWALLPHGPGMRLIEEVVGVEDGGLTARITNHTHVPHPLAREGRLGMAAIIEYAAQAAAVYAIMSGQRLPSAYVAAVHDLALLSPYDLGRVTGPILLTVTVVAHSANAARYAFRAAAETPLARGQLLLAYVGVDS
ncbi:MAG: hypothetical protein ACYCXG_00470 [Acidiferrobacter sp.]